MFTGIIKKVSVVQSVSHKNESLLVSIKEPSGWDTTPGQSIAINGVCSTVKIIQPNGFLVEYMPETVKKTTVSKYKKGTTVNLEKSLTLGSLLDGHLVQGHVDTTGRITEVKSAQESKVMKIKTLAKFMKFIAEKGSVAIDGISLTVVDTGNDWFSVSLVSYTLENTNLGKLQKGERVNIETDVIAKYLRKLLK